MKKYTLEKILPKEKYYEVYMKADANDADYVTTEEYFSQDEFDSIVDELKNLISNYGGSHKLSEYPNDCDFDIPFNGWDGYCHTLEYIDITMYDTDGYTYEVHLNNNTEGEN